MDKFITDTVLPVLIDFVNEKTIKQTSAICFVENIRELSNYLDLVFKANRVNLTYRSMLCFKTDNNKKIYIERYCGKNDYLLNVTHGIRANLIIFDRPNLDYKLLESLRALTSPCSGVQKIIFKH